MKIKTFAILTASATFLAACGGGGGGATGTGGSGAGGGGGGAGSLPRVEPPPPFGTAVDYTQLAERSGTSELSGAILGSDASVTATSGTITHSGQSFTASGISGSQSLNDGSDFELPDYLYAADIEVDSGTVAIVGVATAPSDLRSSGTAAYSGDFSGQLGQAGSPTITQLNWDADVQVNFAGDGDVDMTFTGAGSDLIDEIRILNADISGNGFSGGTIRTSNNGTQNNVTGTSVDMSGAFFGFDDALQLPAEVGGVFASQDADTTLSGVFLSTARP